MSAQPSHDPAPRELGASLSEISRALEHLRDRIQQLGGVDPEGAEAPAPRIDTISAVDPKLFGSLPDALGLPSSGYPPSEMFGIAMDRLARLLEPDRSMLFLLDPERGTLQPPAARGLRRGDLGGVSIAPGEGLVGRAYIEGGLVSHSPPAGGAPRGPLVP